MVMSRRRDGKSSKTIRVSHTVLAERLNILNELPESARFDEFVEGLCARFYPARLNGLGG